jgi:hypothetical protein
MINVSNEKMTELYHAVNLLMAKIAPEGFRPYSQSAANRVSDALFDIDGGAYKEKSKIGHAPIETYKKVVQAASALLCSSEEYDFDDGMGKGAPQECWDYLIGALEPFEEEMSDVNQERLYDTNTRTD